MDERSTLNHLRIRNFRNLSDIKYTPQSNINVIFGANAQGKTNLLEAISLSAQLKSLRPYKNQDDFILSGCDEAILNSQLGQSGALAVNIQLLLGGKKNILLNNKSIRQGKYLREKNFVVSFVPDDLDTIKGAAAKRRKFIDQLTSLLFPNYSTIYKKYEKIVQQRNMLFKINSLTQTSYNSFTALLIKYGSFVIDYRLQALKLLQNYFTRSALEISNKTIKSTIKYTSSIIEKDDSMDEKTINICFENKIAQVRQDEYMRKTTLLGPHLDDILITVGEQSSRYFSSQAQSRILVLALKISLMQCVYKNRHKIPILLLDDVMSEFDEQKAASLISYIESLDIQTFLTTTSLKNLPSIKKYDAVEMVGGSIL